MFNLSLQLSNLWFFDTSSILHPQQSIDWRGNGIHITPYAQRLLTQSLTTCIPLHHQTNPTVRKHWPLRQAYRQLAATHRHFTGTTHCQFT